MRAGGGEPDDGWDVVRAAYRRRHPGRPPRHARWRRPRPPPPGSTRPTPCSAGPSGPASLAAPPRAPAPPPPPPPPPPTVGVAVLGDDTLLLAAPPARGVRPALEARPPGRRGHLRRPQLRHLRGRASARTARPARWSSPLQGRAHGTEAFLTLEAIERPASLDPSRPPGRAACAAALRACMIRRCVRPGMPGAMTDAKEIPEAELPTTEEGWRERLDPLQFEVARHGRHRAGLHRHLLGHQGRRHLPLRGLRPGAVLLRRPSTTRAAAGPASGSRWREGAVTLVTRRQPRHGPHRGALLPLRLAPRATCSRTAPSPPACATA